MLKAKNTAVFGGTFTIVHEGLNGRQMLSQSPYVVHGAIHDSGQRYPPSECHPGTREDILNIALSWVDKPLKESESRMFWLYGPAGVGKTAIAQSLCQRLKELGRLGGDFFLSRSAAGHSDLHALFPTLAYQLAEIHPEFGHELDVVIKTNESVLTKNMGLQFEQLIINPLKRAIHNKSDIPLVFVIDGLDEAGGERDQSLLLRLLDSSFVSHHLPLKLILTSRPEPWIKSAFGANSLAGTTHRQFLHRTSQTDNDIRNVLQFGFANIQNTHDLMKSRLAMWPSSEVIDDIVNRASGQFIYVSTLLRYVEDQNGNPAERLHRIIKTPSKKSMDSPFLALDNLYKHVLSTSLNLERTLTVLGAIIASFRKIGTPFMPHSPYAYSTAVDIGFSERLVSPLRREPDLASTISREGSIDYQSTDEAVSLPIDRIERILNLRVADGLLALRMIQSLVDISSSVELGVKFYHKSFQDFLLDQNRSGEYFIDIGQVYSKLTVGIFWLIRDFEQCETISRREGIFQDLRAIQPRWMEWWLCSATSSQDWLLTEIEAVDKYEFRRWTYRMKLVQRKVPLLYIKLFHDVQSRSYLKQTGRLVEYYRSGGNIAEAISLEINGQANLSLSVERFRCTRAIFEKHLSEAIGPKLFWRKPTFK